MFSKSFFALMILASGLISSVTVNAADAAPSRQFLFFDPPFYERALLKSDIGIVHKVAGSNTTPTAAVNNHGPENLKAVVKPTGTTSTYSTNNTTYYTWSSYWTDSSWSSYSTSYYSTWSSYWTTSWTTPTYSTTTYTTHSTSTPSASATSTVGHTSGTVGKKLSGERPRKFLFLDLIVQERLC